MGREHWQPRRSAGSFPATAGVAAADSSRATTPCRGAGLYGDSSAVDVDFRTCDVGRLIGSQEQNGVRHLVNLSGPAHRRDCTTYRRAALLSDATLAPTDPRVCTGAVI